METWYIGLQGRTTNLNLGKPNNHVLIWLSKKHNRSLLRMKGDFSKEWYKRFHNPPKKVVKMKKMRWTITETDNGRSFLFTKFSVIDFFLTDKRNIFMYTAEIGLWQIFQLSVFVLSHEKYHYPGQRTNFRFFFSYFVSLPFLGNFEWHCLLEIRIFLVFF